MAHKFDPASRHILDSGERRKRLPPEHILSEIGLQAGDTFVDIGCGVGYFSIPASSMMGDSGMVYALDVSKEMLDELKASALKLGITNIRPLYIAEDRFELPARNNAVFFMCNVFHELDDRHGYLKRLRTSMNDSSRLVIIDFYKKETEHAPPVHHRVSLEDVRTIFQECGFTLQRSLEINPEEYGIIAVASKRAP